MSRLDLAPEILVQLDRDPSVLYLAVELPHQSVDARVAGPTQNFPDDISLMMGILFTVPSPRFPLKNIALIRIGLSSVARM